jgi:hypothetical protein
MLPPRRRRSRRRLTWLLATLAALAALYDLAGVYVPRALAGAIAQGVRQQIRTPATVSLDPGPLWQLAFGRFDRLLIQVRSFSMQGVTVTRAQLDWRDGQVQLAPLERGEVVIEREGSLQVQGTVGQQEIEQALADAVRPYLPSGATVAVPQLEIAPQGITLGGSVDVLGVPIPYRLFGALQVADGGRTIDFRTHSLNGSALTLPPVPVLQASQIPKVDGVVWRFSAVALRRGAVTLSLRNVP